MKNEPNCASTWLKHNKKGKKEIGIFELAELFGVTSEALRKYEAKQIIQPFRDERGYRKFHSWDLTKIICARRMRQEGFPLTDIAQSMQCAKAQQRIDMMEAMQKELMQEILYRKKLIAWLSAQKDEIVRLESQGERCIVERQPALHCCVYMAGDTLVDKEGEEREQLKRWLEELPFCNICYIGKLRHDMVSCLVLSEDEKKAYGLEHLKPDFVIPEQFYVVCSSTAEHSQTHDTSDESILRARARAQDMGFSLGDYVVARMVRYVQNEEMFQSVNRMFFPIMEEKMG